MISNSIFSYSLKSDHDLELIFCTILPHPYDVFIYFATAGPTQGACERAEATQNNCRPTRVKNCVSIMNATRSVPHKRRPGNEIITCQGGQNRPNGAPIASIHPAAGTLSFLHSSPSRIDSAICRTGSTLLTLHILQLA